MKCGRGSSKRLVVRRSLTRPLPDDSFLWRVCRAIDEKPSQLAKNIGVAYYEIKPLLDHGPLVEMDRDDTWLKIIEHVDRRLGLMLAVKKELSLRMQNEMLARLKQTQRFKQL